MDRAQKTEAVAELNRTFTEANVVVVTRNLGLTVAESSDLRAKMREAGANFKVSKNKLAKIAIKDTQYDPISDLLVGPTALAWSDDPVAAPKVVADFAKANDRLEIIGGAMGATVLDLDGVKALAALPSLDELRGKIVGLLNAPATKIVQLANAPASKLARVFGAYGASEAA
jgi:large subunit ribosomal protein L10